jgi:hypothetical protein
MIVSGDLLVAAQELQERVGPAGVGTFLQKVLRDPAATPSRAHHLIAQIPFRAALTTNYDALLEGAYTLEHRGRIPLVLTQSDLAARPSLLRRPEFFIFKIHGHLDRIDSIILGSRDYQDLLFRTPGYRQFLEIAFATHTVLFLGFGGADPDLDNVLDRLASIYSRTLDRHFILLPSGRFNTTHKRRLVLDRRLEVIEYFPDPAHSQVVAFLEELRRQVLVGHTSVASPAARTSRPRVFISAPMKDSHLVRRLAGILLEHGYVTWSAAQEPEVGDDLRQKIGEALSSADCVLVVFSVNTFESAWVRYEAEAAMVREATGKTIVIPVVVGDLGDAALPPYFRNRLHLRIRSEFDEHDLAPLFAALERLASDEQPSE